MGAAAAARLGLRAPGLRAPVLLRAIRSTATVADASAGKPITAPGDVPTENLIWMKNALAKFDSFHAAKVADLQKQTVAMVMELNKSETDHNIAISECKRLVGISSWRIALVGGSYLVTAFSLFSKSDD